MSTIIQKMSSYLEDNGLWPEEAKKVIDRYQADPIGKPMEGRWNDEVEGYPPTVLAGVVVGLNRVAVEYIDAECPKHFARSMFEPPR